MVGGQESEPGKWPSIAAPYYNGLPTCTGVLIAPDLVLTAGHCDSVSLDSVLVGADDRSLPETGEWAVVAERHLHERSYDTLDLTLLVLEQPIVDFQPSALAIGCAAGALADDATAWVVGYGSTDGAGNTRTDRLNEVLVPVVDADCDDPSRGCNAEVSPGGELIAGGEGKDSCTGDSGGPLYLVGDNGLTYLAGITSRAALPASVPCGDGGIYVRVDAAQAWIEEVSGRSLAAPDCGGLNRAPSPLDDTLFVRRGEQARLTVPAGDPDPGQDHQWTLLTSPTRVEAWFEGADLVVRGLEAGTQRLTIRVSDGQLTGEADIEVHIGETVPPEALLACGVGPATRPLWLLALLLLVRRRA